MTLSKEQLEEIARSPQAFLRQGRKINMRIAIKERRIQQLRRVSIHITPSLSEASAYTGPHDKVGECAAEIVDLSREIGEEVALLAEFQRLIGYAIATLIPDHALGAIIEARYLAEMSWEEIAVSFHYAYRHVLRLHNKGLSIMQEEANETLRRLDRQEV